MAAFMQPPAKMFSGLLTTVVLVVGSVECRGGGRSSGSGGSSSSGSSYSSNSYNTYYSGGGGGGPHVPPIVWIILLGSIGFFTILGCCYYFICNESGGNVSNDGTIPCYLCLTRIKDSEWKIHRRKCANQNHEKLQSFPRRHDKTCPECLGDLRLWPSMGHPFLCDSKPCRFSGGREIISTGHNRWNCFECDIDYCVHCIGKPQTASNGGTQAMRTDMLNMLNSAIDQPNSNATNNASIPAAPDAIRADMQAMLASAINLPASAQQADKTKCNLCLSLVDNNLWKNGSHRRDCAAASQILGTFDESIIKCPECLKNLKLWPKFGPGDSTFRCDTCPIRCSAGGRDIENDGHNRYCCFLCDYNLCVYCVNASIAIGIREQTGNLPSFLPTAPPPSDGGQNLLPPSYESAISDTGTNINIFTNSQVT